MANLLLEMAALAARLTPPAVKRAVYQLGPISWAIRRILNRAAPSGLTEVAVAAGELSGIQMQLDLQSEKDYWLGTYELDVQHALRTLVQPGWVVFDLGANIGYFTLLAARLVGAGGRVWAFEALPDNVARLRTNLALNQDLAARVAVFSGAVTDRNGPVQFLVGPSGGTGKTEGSAGRRVNYQETISVSGVSLDGFLEEGLSQAPQLVKMDIEGGESMALEGMARLLADARPLLLLELHGSESTRRSWELLTTAGYTLHRLLPGFPRVPEVARLGWKAYLLALPPGHSR